MDHILTTYLHLHLYLQDEQLLNISAHLLNLFRCAFTAHLYTHHTLMLMQHPWRHF